MSLVAVLDNEWLYILPRKPSLAKVLATALEAALDIECGAIKNRLTRDCTRQGGRLYNPCQPPQAHSAHPVWRYTH